MTRILGLKEAKVDDGGINGREMCKVSVSATWHTSNPPHARDLHTFFSTPYRSGWDLKHLDPWQRTFKTNAKAVVRGPDAPGSLLEPRLFGFLSIAHSLHFVTPPYI